MKKILILLPATLITFHSVKAQFINDYSEWEKVEVYEESECGITNQMEKLGTLSLTAASFYRTREEVLEKLYPIVKKYTATAGCDAAKIMFDKMYFSGQGSLGVSLITGKMFTVYFSVYKKKEHPKIDLAQLTKMIEQTKKYTVVKKIQIGISDNFTETETKLTGRIMEIKPDEEGSVFVYADIPTEYTQWYKVIKLDGDQITLYRMSKDFVIHTNIIMKAI